MPDFAALTNIYTAPVGFAWPPLDRPKACASLLLAGFHMYRQLRAYLGFFVFAASISTLRAQESSEATSPASIEPTPVESATPAAESTKARARSEQPTRRDIQDSMTAEDFKAAGLDKLSSEELRHLNAWLQGDRQKVETKAAEKATQEATKKSASETHAKMDALLSRVDGTFTGITGNTIIKLEDGTVWKQANRDDRFRAQITDSPPVKVSHTSFGYKMRVVGTGEFYVDPVHK
jgi:hypothetical protein